MSICQHYLSVHSDMYFCNFYPSFDFIWVSDCLTLIDIENIRFFFYTVYLSTCMRLFLLGEKVKPSQPCRKVDLLALLHSFQASTYCLSHDKTLATHCTLWVAIHFRLAQSKSEFQASLCWRVSLCQNKTKPPIIVHISERQTFCKLKKKYLITV